MSRVRIAVAAVAFVLGGCTGGCPASGPGCCKECSTGKPCGDACIPRSSTCSAGPGCACSVEEAVAEGDDSSG